MVFTPGVMPATKSMYEILENEIKNREIPLYGGVDLASVGPDFQKHLYRYDEWLKDGYHGEMQYLSRGRDRRADPKEVFPDVKSVFCVGIPYRTKRLVSDESNPTAPKFARYLYGCENSTPPGLDYHKHMKFLLEETLQSVREQDGCEDLKWKVCVDTSAVLERTWASLCGIGWIGKNSMLIHPQFGSYFFIGVVFLNRELGRKPQLLKNYCGNCDRCLKSCPTSAFDAPGKLDSRKCISYWTLEKRGELELSSSQEQSIGSWVAGCDICQEVCPFNLKPEKKDLANEGFEAPGYVFNDDWIDFLKWTPSEYKEKIKGIALDRVKPNQFLRNVVNGVSNLLKDNPDYFAGSEHEWLKWIEVREKDIAEPYLLESLAELKILIRKPKSE